MDPSHLASTLERTHDADIADVLNSIDPPAAARVLAALPFELAVRALNQPELDHRARLFEHLPPEKAVPLMDAMSADQRADVFRGLPARTAARLLTALDGSARQSLRSLAQNPSSQVQPQQLGRWVSLSPTRSQQAMGPSSATPQLGCQRV